MRWIGAALGMMMAAGMAAPALAQKAAAPAVLKAATPWVIDYAKDSCGVVRRYGVGAQQVEMVFITLPRSSGATLVFATSSEKGPGSSQPNFGTLKITLPNDNVAFSEHFVSARLGKTDRRYVHVRLDQWQLERMIAANRIEVDAGKPLHIVLEPGRTAAAFKALEPCHASLIESWKIDPEILRTAVSRAEPAGSPQSWVRNMDYPVASLRAREQGITTFRLTIEADGSVGECAILMGSGSEILDYTTCALMRKRAKFRPARDTAGNPVRDLWISRFSWEMPG
jgi:TonB family protein